ncbi:MAG: response regulator [Hyphomonadaceae bacterium]|nr:response regulator [Hyphomonadaceae bacterium]
MTVSLERLKVFVVDDNHHMINIIKAILRGFGVKDILDAINPLEALNIVRTTKFDLIITDFAMEPIDGCELTKTIRAEEGAPNRLTPIIMLSAYAERSKVEIARDAGITEFCAKPVTATELYRKIAAAANSPRPFVRTNMYSGPDRRRRKNSPHEGPERREAPLEFGDTGAPGA